MLYNHKSTILMKTANYEKLMKNKQFCSVSSLQVTKKKINMHIREVIFFIVFTINQVCFKNNHSVIAHLNAGY